MKITFKKIMGICLSMVLALSVSLPTYAFEYDKGHLTIKNNEDFVNIDALNKDRIETVTIGNGVKEIKQYAFQGCTSLEEVTIPSNVTKIGQYSFKKCEGLEKVTIEDNAEAEATTTIDKQAFKDCTELRELTIGNCVKSIGNRAFMNCTSLQEVTIPDSVKSIGGGAFKDCTGLTSITIPDSVTSIGQQAFDNIDKNCEFHLTIGKEIENKKIEDIVSIPKDKVKFVIIKDSVTKIGIRAFSGCTGLTSITIPDSVKSIGGGAFKDCTDLTSINVDTRNPKYKSIDGVLFSKDGTKLIKYPEGKNADNYTVSDSVTSVGKWAFYGCTGLTSINIPDSVTSIGEAAFRGCKGLTSINVDEGNPNYKSIDGVLFSKDGTELIQYPEGKDADNYDIPDIVTSIGENAFNSCTSLTSINIPNSVTNIGDWAFHGCKGLKEVTIPKGTAYFINSFDKNTTVHRK